MRGATAKRPIGSRIARISIHAPRAGRDNYLPMSCRITYISIHAPRAGRDIGLYDGYKTVFLFQSTRPVRGATS